MDPNEVIAIFRRNVSEHYFDLAGRVSRKEFWYFVLGCVAVSLAAAIIGIILGTSLLGLVVNLALLLPMAGMGARRLQDTGRNGQIVWIWVGLDVLYVVIAAVAALAALTSPFGALGIFMIFLSLSSLIGLAMLVIAVVLIYLWAQPGVAGPNQYGPDPLAAPAPSA